MPGVLGICNPGVTEDVKREIAAEASLQRWGNLAFFGSREESKGARVQTERSKER